MTQLVIRGDQGETTAITNNGTGNADRMNNYTCRINRNRTLKASIWYLFSLQHYSKANNRSYIKNDKIENRNKVVTLDFNMKYDPHQEIKT